jgi:O-antigen/teichoic acid export membrane protein
MSRPVSIPDLFRFWLPLQATWLMMALEGPFLAAVIARLAEPKHNLAAYGVAFALAILVEAPVIMMMSASTALVDSAGIYRRLRHFMWLLNGGITAVMLLLLLTPLWSLLTAKGMNLDPEVARLARTSMFIMLPWPAAIGYRRFYQGLLIRVGLTRRVAWGTLLRLTTMAVTGFLLYRGADLPGAWVGAIALSAGVTVEAVASRVMAAGAVTKLLATSADHVPGYREIWEFYLPLALTSTIALAVQPLVTFFMGQARFSLESLAVLPVINALVFIFRTPGLSYQEAAITMLGRSWDNLHQVRLFAMILGVGAALGLGLIVLTPLLDIWLGTVSGLTPELADFARTPLRLLVLMPLLSVVLSLQRSLLVARRRTGAITWASTLEVVGILAVLFVTIRLGDWIGATAAAAAFMVGRLAANLFLVGKTGEAEG